MTNRVQIGNRNGVYGAWVSKPGVDVQSANEMQLAFSSSWPHARLIARGTIVIGASGSGGGENTYDIPFGTNYNPVPFVWAIASASDWNMHAKGNDAAQYTYLTNRWHTYVFEVPGYKPATGNSYPSIGTIARGSDVSDTWASIKFVADSYTDRVRFRVNNYSAGTQIKYLIMDVN